MTRFTKALTAVLAVSFGAMAVRGASACLIDPATACAPHFIAVFTDCGITDADMADLSSCLTSIGRGGISFMNLTNNAFTTVDASLFDGMVSLQELWMANNMLTTLQTGLFVNAPSVKTVFLDENAIDTIEDGAFTGLDSLYFLSLNKNKIDTIGDGAFTSSGSLFFLRLGYNDLTAVQADRFSNLESLSALDLSNNNIATIDADAFVGAASTLEHLYLGYNELEALPEGLFAGMGNLVELGLYENNIEVIEADTFRDLVAFENLSKNALTTLPADLFEELTSLEEMNLDDNPNLQCVPTVPALGPLNLPVTDGMCECTPAAAVVCGVDEVCVPGAVGYTCGTACTDDTDCDAVNNEACCPLKGVCEAEDTIDAGACGDPHMTGFRGQKFDFVGKDNAWYAVVSDLPYMHLNMRVTSPVASVPEITYITGIAIVTTDADGLDHTIVISVADPHNLESSCPVEMTSCLADGALHVVVDGEEVLLSPGEFALAPGVAIAAVNLPGACRSFGFEKYWERKKLELELLAQSGRRLKLIKTLQEMSTWILSDPTATNMVECVEYVARSTAVDGVGLFAHQSEHASFQILTPTATVRVSHGRLHQLAMRDPTDQFDLPDHLAWQMNMAIDHSDMSRNAAGILGETLVNTVDDNGTPIMQGMGVIRGKQEDYRVNGPLGVIFPQGHHHQ